MKSFYEYDISFGLVTPNWWSVEAAHGVDTDSSDL